MMDGWKGPTLLNNMNHSIINLIHWLHNICRIYIVDGDYDNRDDQQIDDRPSSRGDWARPVPARRDPTQPWQGALGEGGAPSYTETIGRNS